MSVSVLTVLSARPYFVRQMYSQRGHFSVLSVFISQGDSVSDVLRGITERRSSAQLLSRLCSDSLSGRRVRLDLQLFLPDLILDKLSDAEVACALYMNDYNNPELIWNRTTRQRVSDAVGLFTADLRRPLPSSPVYSEFGDDDAAGISDYQVAGVYLHAFLATPGWVVRSPKRFATELIERWIRTVSAGSSELLQLITDCLVSLFSSGGGGVLMDSAVPATGAIPFVCSALVHPDAGVCALKLVACLVDSEPCFKQMADMNAALGGHSPLAASLLVQLDRRPDLLPVIAALIASIAPNDPTKWTMNHGRLLADMIECGLIKRVLQILDGESEPHRLMMDNTCRAYLVGALKAMNEAAPDKMNALLDACESWADYKHQRHDLFILNDGPMDRLARLTAGNTPHVAGYLTSVPSSVAFGNIGETEGGGGPPPPNRVDRS